MKHLLVILFLVVAGYASWVASDPDERQKAVRLVTHHGLRLGALILIALLLLASAVYLPASSIL